MDTINPLMWTLSLLVAYPMVFLAFHVEPMQHIRPWMRCAAIALTSVYLTTRLIRTEMADTPNDHTWADTPIPQAAAITIFFGILANTGAASLIAGATILIVSDMAWILETLSARAGL